MKTSGEAISYPTKRERQSKKKSKSKNFREDEHCPLLPLLKYPEKMFQVSSHVEIVVTM